MSSIEFEEQEAWQDMCGIPVEPPASRARCENCRRPTSACWCEALPAERLNPRGRILLLQHPAEERRCLQTARVLQLGLAPGRCLLYRGKRFPTPAHEKDPHDAERPPLAHLLASPQALLLYPSADACSLSTLTLPEYDLVILDGTWPQAKAILAASPALRGLRAIKLPPHEERASRYVIRTQPARGCLSTLEAAAEALSLLERSPLYLSALLPPLDTLCSIQLRCGAVKHHAADDVSQEAMEGRANQAAPKLIARRLARQLRTTPDSKLPA